MKESAIVGKIVKAVRKEYRRAYCRKIADRFTRGLADVIVVFEAEKIDPPFMTYHFGAILFVEVKTLDGKTSKIQDEEHRQIRLAGGEVIVATSAAEVLAKMREMGAVK